MQVFCHKCGQRLTGNDINVTTDIARCPRCDEVFILSSLVQGISSYPVDVNDPPRGAWYEAEINGFVVGATTRSPAAFIAVPFMCVWSGGSLGGIYGRQIAQGQFNLVASLVGIPFVLGTLLFGSLVLMMVCGKVVVRICDSEGVVFTGIGQLGWRRPFRWVEVATVRIAPYPHGNNKRCIVIVQDGPRKLHFGSLLTDARQDFVANVLRQELAKSPRPTAG